jgi:hypothetical protein
MNFLTHKEILEIAKRSGAYISESKYDTSSVFTYKEVDICVIVAYFPHDDFTEKIPDRVMSDMEYLFKERKDMDEIYLSSNNGGIFASLGKNILDDGMVFYLSDTVLTNDLISKLNTIGLKTKLFRDSS